MTDVALPEGKDVVQLVQGAANGLSAALADRIGEIGRASCRERV